MFRKTITLSVLALLVAVASCRPQFEQNECSGRENGLYPDESDINAFFVCMDDELVVHSKCDPGEFFHAVLKTCIGGLKDQDLVAYSGDGEADDLVDHLESQVSNALKESMESEEESEFLGHTRPRPPPPPPSGHRPFPFKNKIVNVQVTKNIFPKSVVVIGRANREQKNK